MSSRVAVYVRVSTPEQDPTNQCLELRAWAEKEGYRVVAEYQDIASGARRRERLDDLFDDARHGRFDTVAIWSLDRLTREEPLACLLYLQRVTKLGIKVYSHQEPYLDPRLPFYESIVSFLADIARWERERRSERTKAGPGQGQGAGQNPGPPQGEEGQPKKDGPAANLGGQVCPDGLITVPLLRKQKRGQHGVSRSQVATQRAARGHSLSHTLRQLPR